MDVSGHNTNLALSGLDDAGTVGTDESTGCLLVQVPFHLIVY